MKICYLLITVSFLWLAQSSFAQETLQTVTDRGATTSHKIELNNGAVVSTNNLILEGSTMGYKDPILVKGNLDNAGLVSRDAALRFDQPIDVMEGGVPSSLIFHYPRSGIPYFRRDGHDFTVLKIWSPRNNKDAYESTLALVNGDDEDEFLDLYNMSYPSAKCYGIRMQKRYAGNYKPFHFEYSDGSNTYKVFTLDADSTATFYGNVGIGTSDSKGYNLAVAGSMIAESVMVKLKTAWPDYVFSPTYQQRTLAEIEQYINKNGHLPGVPKAVDVEENGMDIGKMNIILLEKIEELTLHLIDQQKEIQRLSEQNREIIKSMATFKAKN